MPKRKSNETKHSAGSRKRRKEKPADRGLGAPCEIAVGVQLEPTGRSRPLEYGSERQISSYPNVAYTVGWICALSIELAAAKGMLDERHGDPQVHPEGDHNAYILGRIGQFNVAIACLPSDEYGTSSAANVAGAMWSTFPNLKIGLFVGIGAGIPHFTGDNPLDIRLGDVVVGTRVVDYELGKRLDGGRKLNTGHQDKPPKISRSALSQLRAEHQVTAPKVKEYIEATINDNPAHTRFIRPDRDTDRLCHPCLVGAPCPGGRDVKLSHSRSRRPENEPHIHYGTIASGNTVCKDRGFREEIHRQFGAICFDMEAAGVMNNFSGLVIRGVSDCADQHKNDEWHAYAAAAAAAYAKLLLDYVPLSVGGVRLHGETPSRNKMLERDGQDLDVLNWLTTETFESRHVDHLDRLQQGTGQWFLNSEQFQEFVDGRKKRLFCYGMPGAGKTMISTLVIDFFRHRARMDPTIAVCFIYFDFRERNNNIANTLAILLRQLAEQQQPLPESLYTLYRSHRTKSGRPSIRELSCCLEASLSRWSRAFLVVDALDECPSTINMRANLTSVEIQATTGDIGSYVDGYIGASETLARQKGQLKAGVKQKVLEAVDGMFLLAHLYLIYLSTLRMPRDINDAIHTFARGTNTYSSTFAQTMRRIEQQDMGDQQLAKKILYWLTYARRPLEPKELQHALTLRPSDTRFCKDGMPTLDDIVAVCVGLVVLDAESNVIRLVHYTAHEYLESTGMEWFPDAQMDILRTCIQYLSLDLVDWDRPESVRSVGLDSKKKKYVLWDYAANYWGYHAQGVSTEDEQIIIHSLNSSKVRYLMCLGMERPDDAYDLEQMWLRGGTACHLAAHFDLDRIIDQLLESAYNVNDQDKRGATPLWWAAANGSEKALRRLLAEERIDVNARGPFQETSLNNDVEMVTILLAAGADPVWRRNGRRSTMQYAKRKGYMEVFRLLKGVVEGRAC
ncbi:hypothetical protein BDW74DRAFT_188962 [Aspergillus multicolor]|uniref:uncharacterized protein n=1 Tax=Aspergillus multicolor TaxID=41759 RepID=UPI003CCDB0DB